MHLNIKIEKYLGRPYNFLTEVLLQDDGDGVYIKEWNVAESQPELDELNKIDVSNELALMKVRSDRRNEYPQLAEQLDLLYHDMVADKGTKAGEWFKAIKKVKDDNAKP